MTRLVIDTHSAPAWEPGARVEVRLIAPDIEHTVTGILVAAGPEPTAEDEIMERLSADNPKARRHSETTADRYSTWTCVPIRDVMEVRAAALAARSTPDPSPEPLDYLRDFEADEAIRSAVHPVVCESDHDRQTSPEHWRCNYVVDAVRSAAVTGPAAATCGLCGQRHPRLTRNETCPAATQTAGAGGLAERIAALPTVTISPARRNGSTRGVTRRKAVFLDDVLAALAAARPSPAEPREGLQSAMPGDEGRLYNPVHNTGRRNTDRVYCGHWMGGDDSCVRPPHKDAEGHDDGSPHRAPSRRDDHPAALAPVAHRAAEPGEAT